eukprot:scaffold134530_cov18-Tisochrysis_lutea.AAC.4
MGRCCGQCGCSKLLTQALHHCSDAGCWNGSILKPVRAFPRPAPASLEWVISEASAGASKTSPSVNGNGGAGVLGEEGRVLAARRLHTRLPSFSGEFRQSTPLTKI